MSGNQLARQRDFFAGQHALGDGIGFAQRPRRALAFDAHHLKARAARAEGQGGAPAGELVHAGQRLGREQRVHGEWFGPRVACTIIA